MHQSQGPGSYTHRSESGIEDHRYTHASVKVKDRGTSASYMNVSGPRIMHHTYVGINDARINRLFVRSFVRPEQNFSRIIHTCSIVKDRGTLINSSYMHVSGPRIMDKCIMHIISYSYASWIYASHASGIHASRIYA